MSCPSLLSFLSPANVQELPGAFGSARFEQTHNAGGRKCKTSVNPLAWSCRRITAVNLQVLRINGVPYEIRTRVTAVKEKRPVVIQRNLAAWIALYRSWVFNERARFGRYGLSLVLASGVLAQSVPSLFGYKILFQH